MAEGFNTFVSGQPAAAGVAAADLVPVVQGGSTRKAAAGLITPYSVVSPSGGDDTSSLNAAFAGSATRPVFLSVGVYNVSAPLNVPDEGIVVGEDVLYKGPGYVSPSGSNRTVIQVSSFSGFSGHQGIVNVGNFCYLRGFTVLGTGNSGNDHGITGINFSNKQMLLCENVSAQYCYAGFYDLVTGSLSSQGIKLTGCNAYNNSQYGIYLSNQGASGGFISDYIIDNCWCNANHGEILIFGAAVAQISNCRLEDGGTNPAIVIVNSSWVSLTNIFMDREPGCLSVSNSNKCNFIGLRVNSYSGAAADIALDTSVTYSRFIGTQIDSSGALATYSATLGTDLTGTYFDSIDPNNDFGSGQCYADTDSRNIIAPRVLSRGPLVENNQFFTVTPSSNNFAPNLYIAKNFDLTLTHGVTNTVLNPLGSSTPIMPQSGWFRFEASATGGDTVAWGANYLNQPTMTLTASTFTYVPYVVNNSGYVILGTAVQNVAH